MPRRADAPDPDLDLAVALVNTVDLLEAPPDRLISDDAALRVLGRHGAEQDVRAYRPGDLPALRAVRDRLAQVFGGGPQAVPLLNAWLAELGAVPSIVETAEHTWELTVAAGGYGVAALGLRLPAALVRFTVRWGPQRLGCCAADPCRCAYLDRTPAGTRRYCCQLCADRVSAAAYRRRGRQ